MTHQAELARLVEEATSQEDFIDRAARLCMQWIGADRAVFMDLRDGRQAVTPVSFDEESLRRFHECQLLMPSCTGEMQPVFEAVARDGLYVEDELYSERDRGRLRIFTEISRPQRSHTNAAFLLKWRGRAVASVRFERVGTTGVRFTREMLAPVIGALPTLSLAWTAVSGQATLPAAPRAVGLTPRERELCRYVARGLHNSEIAQLLGSSPNTVRNQLSTLFKKVEVTTRTELALWAEDALSDDAEERVTPAIGLRIIDTLTKSSKRIIGGSRR